VNPNSIPSKLLRIGIRAVLFGVFVVLPGLLFYLNGAGVAGAWAQEISRALSSPNLQVEVRKLTLNPFEGISAHEVRVYNSEGVKLADVSRVLVGLNLSALVQRRVEIESVELARADLSIPVSGGAPIQVFDVRGHLLISPTQVHLTELGFRLAGIQFLIAGTVQRDHSLSARPWTQPAAKGQAGSPERLIEQIRETLEQCAFGATAPTVRIELGGSGSSPETLEALIQADFPEIQWKGFFIRPLRLEAAYARQMLTVKSLSARDSLGELNAALTLDFARKKLQADVQSSLDVSRLPELLTDQEWGRQITLHEPPQVNLEASLDFSRPQADLEVNGSLDLANFQVKGVPFDRLNGDFTYQKGVFLTRDFTVRAPNLELLLDLWSDADGIRARVQGTVDPLPLQPLLGSGLGVIFGQMEFAERGTVQFEARLPRANPGALSGSGKVQLGRTAMRGAWVDSGRADVEIKDRAVHYRNIEVRRGKGVGTGNFVYDFGGRQVRLENIQSTLNPQEIMLWVDAGIAKTVAEYRFKSNPAVTAEGVVDMAKPERSSLDITVKAGGGLDYDLLKKTLSFGATDGNVKLRGPMIYADVKSAKLFGGVVSLKAEVPVTKDIKNYRIDVRANHVNFPQLTQLYFNYDNSKGWLSGNFSYEAPMADSQSLVGKGGIRIEEGNVFGIPIFGPFSGILNLILPGVGIQTSRKATADFSIENKTIHTDNLEIEGTGFSMYGEGDIYFTTDKMDMSMRINAKGVPGIVLFPVSKLFEYVSYGPLSDPVWRPKNVPRQLFGDSPREDANPANRRDSGLKPGGR